MTILLFLCSRRYCPANIPQLHRSASCLQDNSSARTTQKTQPLYCWRGLFTASLHSNGLEADHIENAVLILLRACCWRYLATATICRVSAYEWVYTPQCTRRFRNWIRFQGNKGPYSVGPARKRQSSRSGSQTMYRNVPDHVQCLSLILTERNNHYEPSQDHSAPCLDF
jgi:hypothetical protein